MAFFLTPRFAPTHQQCSPFACAPARTSYRQVSRPSFPSFVPFLSQVDELLGEINREAQRQAHQQRQQRKRAFRARFDVRENAKGYQVDGEVPGFEQENISIEVTDEHTLKVAGNTEQKNEQQAQPGIEAGAAEAQTAATEPEADAQDKMDGVTLNEPETSGVATPTHSDTDSHRSYQATVEDDFEDLGAETSSTISASSSPSEPKGKERAVEQPTTTNTETAVQQQTQPEVPAQPQQPENHEWLSERYHGSFERTFRFSDRIDTANVKASLKNGVLSITVPKAPFPEIRRILIQ